ncbi:Peptidase M16, middle/third domain [Phytophthora cactorum]|nr:Peptidase M16, middle/third domain [Phytophthora cactorum]
MANPGTNSALRLPPPNAFVVTDLNLVDKNAVNTQQPQVIRDDDFCRVWYKPDVKFKKPRTFAVATFHSPEVNPTPYNYALSALFVACLKDELNEYSYDALLAGMNYKLRLNGSNIYLSTGGYSSKLPILVQRILEAWNHIGDEAFERVKHAKCRSFENMRLEEAHRHAVQQESNLLHERSWSVDDIVSAIRTCSFCDVIAHSKRLFRQVFCDILLYGNLNMSAAMDLAGVISEHLELYLCRRRRSTGLGDSETFLWSERYLQCVHPNPDNANCAVNCIYQIGVENYMDRAKLALFSQIVDEPLFDQLRTKEQLGYTVYSLLLVGMIVVQSNVAPPEFIEQRIDTFWSEFRNMLTSMSYAQLQKHIQSVVKGYIEKPKSQEEEVQTLLVEIANHQYEFGRKMKLGELVRTLQSLMCSSSSTTSFVPGVRSERNCSETGWSIFNCESQAGLMAAMALDASGVSSPDVKTEYVKNSEDFKRRASCYEAPVASL